MKKQLTTLTVALTLAGVVAAGCGSSAGSTAATADTTEITTATQEDSDVMTTITGELTYRERIALIPGGVAVITLADASKQDTAATVIAETTIDLADQQVPIPFELVADTAGLNAQGTYVLRATITGPGDDLQWTTDTANVVDITQADVDLGMLMLVRAGDAATDDTSGTASSALVGDWNVTEVDGTTAVEGGNAMLVFGDDATLGGNTGCNSFSTTYSIDGDVLVVDAAIATTLMACEPALTEQETSVLAILGDMATFEIDGDTLTLTTNDGATLIAQR